MTNVGEQAFHNFQASATKELNKFLSGMEYDSYKAAADLILDSIHSGGRLHITGI